MYPNLPTPAAKEAARQQLACLMAEYAGEVEQAPGYQAKPLPPRRRQIDQETRLQRQDEPRTPSAALEIIRRYRRSGAHAIQKQLREIGVSMRRSDIEAAGARIGAWVYGSVT